MKLTVASVCKTCEGFRLTMIERLTASALICVLLVPGSSSSYRSDSPPILVHMVDASWTLHPTAGPMIVTNCLTVSADGRYRIDLSRQEFYGSDHGDHPVNFFVSSLNAQQLRVLRGLLDADQVKAQPPAVEPKTPLSSDTNQEFEADILRGANIQHIGYFSWTGEAPDAPENLKATWKQSERVLQPLVLWFRTLKTQERPKWQRLTTPNLEFCEAKL